jgi:DNA-binding NarL/FixJ family response regulator
MPEPITVALVDDYDVVLLGLAHMFDGYEDRVRVVEIDSRESVESPIDVVMYDSFAQPESDQDEIDALIRNPRAGRVVVYTLNFHPSLITSAIDRGVHGYLSKAIHAGQLVESIEAIYAGDTVIDDATRRVRSIDALDWPGKAEGITDRESEILALITQGKSNADVARLTYLSPNTVKSYIRSIYRKIGANSRTQAVIWGMSHGFRPDSRRIEMWRLPTA